MPDLGCDLGLGLGLEVGLEVRLEAIGLKLVSCMTLVSSCEARGGELDGADSSSSDAELLFELAATEKEDGQAPAESATNYRHLFRPMVDISGLDNTT